MKLYFFFSRYISVRIQKDIDKERKSIEKAKQKLEAKLEKESANPSRISFFQEKKDSKIETINAELSELSDSFMLSYRLFLL